jgi:hypothetical protein
MIFLKTFAEKISKKIGVFLLKLLVGFWEKRQFFRRKFWKSQKIVIITSTPGWPDEFVKKSPKMYPNSFLSLLLLTLFRWKKVAQKFFTSDLAAWSSGIVSACHRGDCSYGSWDRIQPGYKVVVFLEKIFTSVFKKLPDWLKYAQSGHSVHYAAN